MSKLTVFVGLPGSGKSYAAREFAAKHGLEYLEDAYHPHHVDDTTVIVEALKLGDYVIDSVKMIHPNARKELDQEVRQSISGVAIEWVCFENDPLTCIKNIIHDYEVKGRSNWLDRIETVLRTTSQYKTADKVSVLPVYKAFVHTDPI